VTLSIHTVLQNQAKDHYDEPRLHSRPRPDGQHRFPRHKTPLWVKGFLVAAAVIVVAFAVMHLTGGGMVMNHRP
jgi:hypothetical protein